MWLGKNKKKKVIMQAKLKKIQIRSLNKQKILIKTLHF